MHDFHEIGRIRASTIIGNDVFDLFHMQYS